MSSSENVTLKTLQERCESTLGVASQPDSFPTAILKAMAGLQDGILPDDNIKYLATHILKLTAETAMLEDLVFDLVTLLARRLGD